MADPILLAELRRDESVERFPYDDKTGKPPKAAGKVSIGVGRNLTDNGLYDDEVDFLLANDIERRVNPELDKHIPWWRDLDPVRRRVIQNMCFNMGWPRFSQFNNTLAAVKAKQWSKASTGMLDSLWASQVGLRANRLAKQMRTGVA